MSLKLIWCELTHTRHLQARGATPDGKFIGHKCAKCDTLHYKEAWPGSSVAIANRPERELWW